jgi:hypothetical protein
MRNVHKTIAYIEHTLIRGLERKAVPPREKPKHSYVWRAPTTMTTTEVRYPIERVFTPKEKPMSQLIVNARAMKITAPLDAAAVATLPAPDGQARSKLVINCEGKNYTADVATKSLRKVKATIAASGAENVFVMVQGKLKNNKIVECGIVAQVKVAKVAECPPAAAMR